MKLAPEARKAHKLWSVQAGTLTVAFAIAEAVSNALPMWHGVLPDGLFAVLTALAGTATVVLRLLHQEVDNE